MLATAPSATIPANAPQAATLPPAFEPRLLAGQPPSAGPESWEQHRSRLGELPGASARRAIIATIERSGLIGRGGGGFPVGRKWRSVAERSRRGAVVVANGAEGEPRSAKDRALMHLRPHLVIDGGLVAAQAIGAGELVVYVGPGHPAAVRAMRGAVAERGGRDPVALRLVDTPHGSVSGEAT